MGKPGANAFTRRLAHLEGKAAGWLQNVNLLSAALGPRGPGEPLLGRPLHPCGFVRLAVVKQGSSWDLLFQVHLLGNVSFRVLLLGEAELGPGLALRVGCSQGSQWVPRTRA